MEEWKDIKGFEGLYQVSNYGRVKSVERNEKRKSRSGKECIYHKKEAIKRPSFLKTNYSVYDLWKDNVPYRFLTHHLVANAFISNPNNYEIVHHIDEDRNNNCVENLMWMSDEEHRCLHSKERTKKVHQYDIKTMEFIKTWDSAADAEKELGIQKASICKNCNNKGYKSAGGFVWSYEKIC